ncbi:MAG: bifunctional 5,10-methylenetetrahydrofolate dehydrogenase/5,10-methenyltetrahydrofolate cyclohydrolase [Defluviitaleaceae bacterium]|nr:bifunctional 5,10-methylenetetrahydrofolate dehydrogenase/5,10-methenyltetrahydrofolate cyclohydrolase [Defluviitaleaceae bacterium]MCL2239784.1 bifunctional 5,10-methylenetetrahydrofolate dehydrogenase/5,10-methenyltetrahydrofolate cyclohydrolase [Defluviitaleaceae bacterium]
MDGNALAKRVRMDVKKQAARLDAPPGLAVIIVGHNPASEVYVAHKEKDCARCGIVSHTYRLGEEAGQEKLPALIHRLNNQPDIHGILVQLPLPGGYGAEAVLQAIAPEKDVDAFHTVTAGKFYLNKGPTFLPCTPAGVMELLDAYAIDPRGKHAVVVGHSNIVGKPMAMMLLQRDATVTICHIHTADLAMHTRMADILVCAVGKAGLITAGMVKPGAVVIDVGINRDGNKICGDVDFDAVGKIASHITPVPGGVGPMTRAMLMKNTLEAAKNIATR